MAVLLGTPIRDSYQGQIYLDVPYDAELPEEQQHPQFKKCLAIIENGAGQVKWEGVKLRRLKFNKAIEIGQLSQK